VNDAAASANWLFGTFTGLYHDPVRPGAVAALAIVCALVGGSASLLIGRATGWIGDDGTDTVFVRGGGDGSEAAVPVEREPARPLLGNEFDPAAIYAARADGVVTIVALFGAHADDGSGAAAQGSGFVVSDDGYVLTNSHVITTAGEEAPGESPEAAATIFVEFRDGDRVPARVVGWDVFDDVGLLKVDPDDHPLEPVPLGDSSRVVVGQPVAAIGSPFGQMSSLSVGVVAGTERSIESLTSEYDLVDAIQTDAPINRGNSGGPMFDARGTVIGINAQIRSESGTAEGVGFAIPINSAKRSMEQLIQTGRVRYAWVGISTQSVTPSLAERFDLPVARGAAIQEVVSGSPAADAGLRGGGEEEMVAGVPHRPGGDIVVSINGRPIADAEDLVRAITERFLPGETIRLGIFRGGERVTVDVELAERPATPPPR
jgi:2-alkenal reductase